MPVPYITPTYSRLARFGETVLTIAEDCDYRFFDHDEQNYSLDDRVHCGREFDAQEEVNEIAKDHSPAALKWYLAHPEIGEKHGHEGY